MASAKSFLVNANPIQDVRMLDSFIDPHIFEHPMFKNLEFLVTNSTEMVIDARYNMRPDLLSYELYGTNFYYPVILVVNKIGSIFQFKAEYMNNRCLIPSIDVISTVLTQASADLLKQQEKGK